MADPLDNDLLTLWLRAKDLTPEEIREIIMDFQAERHAHAETLEDKLSEIEDLEQTAGNLQDELDSLRSRHEEQLLQITERLNRLADDICP